MFPYISLSRGRVPTTSPRLAPPPRPSLMLEPLYSPCRGSGPHSCYHHHRAGDSLVYPCSSYPGSFRGPRVHGPGSRQFPARKWWGDLVGREPPLKMRGHLSSAAPPRPAAPGRPLPHGRGPEHNTPRSAFILPGAPCLFGPGLCSLSDIYALADIRQIGVLRSPYAGCWISPFNTRSHRGRTPRSGSELESIIRGWIAMHDVA